MDKLSIDQFLSDFKKRTETHWKTCKINPGIFGFQFQQGTRWIEGLTESEVDSIQSSFNLVFPDSFRRFLAIVNGTDLPTVNVFGSNGYPHKKSPGFYSFPRDRSFITDRFGYAEQIKVELLDELDSQGIKLPSDTVFYPIYSHRYIACTDDQNYDAVFSIWNEGDAICYGDSLVEYLKREFAGAFDKLSFPHE